MSIVTEALKAFDPLFEELNQLKPTERATLMQRLRIEEPFAYTAIMAKIEYEEAQSTTQVADLDYILLSRAKDIHEKMERFVRFVIVQPDEAITAAMKQLKDAFPPGFMEYFKGPFMLVGKQAEEYCKREEAKTASAPDASLPTVDLDVNISGTDVAGEVKIDFDLEIDEGDVTTPTPEPVPEKKTKTKAKEKQDPNNKAPKKQRGRPKKKTPWS